MGGLFVLSTAIAADQAAPPRPGVGPGANQPPEVSIAQKEMLVRKLVEDSDRRVAASGSEAAARPLASAREFYAQAVDSIQRSDFAAAEQQLNAALRAAGEARRLVPDAAQRGRDLRTRHAQLLGGIESLTASYRRHLLRVKGLPVGAPLPPDADLARISALTDKAKGMAAADRYDDANQALAQAEQVLMFALNRLLGAETLEYAQRFETQAEEFDHELERNRSYQDLIPMAIAELRPSAEAMKLMQGFVEQNRLLRDQARQAAERKDYPQALKSLRAGTAYLQRALLAGGLALPQEAKSE